MKAKTLIDKTFIPTHASWTEACQATTHLAIGAHQDDLEIMAYHGIAACYHQQDQWFGGVIATNGAGSPRSGKYQNYSDAEMQQVRHGEQIKAAEIGHYAFVTQLGYPSQIVKSTEASPPLVQELREILIQVQPRILYLHNPFDSHATHIALLTCCLQALKDLPPEQQPQTVYGCEVWRSLDWLHEEHKVALPTDQHPELASQLLNVFESQISGGKNYHDAALGRRKANATFYHAHQVDTFSSCTWALNLTSLIRKNAPALSEFMRSRLTAFNQAVFEKWPHTSS
ncbi:MAG: PIG-L family deacetylase [Verrucomicrobiota bacterium]